MAIARVGSQASGKIVDNATSTTIAFPVNVTNGNLIVLGVFAFTDITHDTPIAGDVTKSAGTATIGTVTLDDHQERNTTSPAAGWIEVAIWSAPVTGTGSLTMSIAGLPTGSFWGVGIEEYSGTDVSGSRVAGVNSGQNTTGAPVTGSVNPGGEGAFFGVVATNTSGATTHTAGTGYTNVFESEDGTNHMTGSTIDQISASTDTADWTAPTTVEWLADLVVYKVAGAATPPFTPNHSNISQPTSHYNTSLVMFAPWMQPTVAYLENTPTAQTSIKDWTKSDVDVIWLD